MKKFLLLILIVSLVFTIVSCASEQMDDSASESTAETTTTSNTTTTETTTTETTETTVNHPYGGTGDLPSYETTNSAEVTNPEDRYNLGIEYVMEYDAFIIANGEEYEPYTSTIYYSGPYMTGDGILMFVSIENQLPHWIEDDVIPDIALDSDSDVRFEYHEDAELKHTGKFRIYLQDENGKYFMGKELTNSNLSEVYAYGKEHFSGQTVCISYPFMLQYGDYSHLPDAVWGDRAVHDIMCVFKTTF